MADESIEIKIVRLDERLNSALRETAQLRTEFTEAHKALRIEMDKRFEKVEKGLEELSGEVRTLSEAVNNKLADIALQLQSITSTVKEKEASVKFGWKVICVVATIATSVGGVVSFLFTHIPK